MFHFQEKSCPESPSLGDIQVMIGDQPECTEQEQHGLLNRKDLNSHNSSQEDKIKEEQADVPQNLPADDIQGNRPANADLMIEEEVKQEDEQQPLEAQEPVEPQLHDNIPGQPQNFVQMVRQNQDQDAAA